MTPERLTDEIAAVWPLAQTRARQLLGTESRSRPVLARLADPIRGEAAFTIIDLIAFIWLAGVYDAGCALAGEEARSDS